MTGSRFGRNGIDRRRLWLLTALAAALVAFRASPAGDTPSSPAVIRGSVCDRTGPVVGATVRIPATTLSTTTDSNGRFLLRGVPSGLPLDVTAAAPGYYIAGSAPLRAGTGEVELVLDRHPDADDPSYRFTSAFAKTSADAACESCHADPANPGAPLPFSEWRADVHSRSALNPRFLSMYAGTHLDGRKSPPVRYTFVRDYGRLPLAPDLRQPYFGPGFRLDSPTKPGNCGACHVPVAALNDPYGVDPMTASGVATEGATCDFCHKVWDVKLDPRSGLPYENTPGVLSFAFRRPGRGQKIFLGPLDDVGAGADVHSPLQRRSEFCAPCHHGHFWGVLVYGSFSEWQASRYSDPVSGKTCQDCHMPSGMTDHFVRLDKGGLVRDPGTIASHLMPGASDGALLRNAARLTLTAWREGDRVSVEVEVNNHNTGHHLPTDSPLRNVLLVVEAIAGDGTRLPLEQGPVLPEWAGDLGGRPGRAYAKVLEERWTQLSPTGAYWNPIRVVADTRIPAFGVDSSRYAFKAPRGTVTVEARLLYRRAYQRLAQWKGWTDPEIVMATQRIEASSHRARSSSKRP